jgi:endonuclease-8
MPEGHTIHRLARDQTASIGRQKLRVSSPQGRFAEDAMRIDGRVLREVEAAGKHLFYHFTGGRVLHVHLGLFGKFRTHENPPPPPRGAVRVRFEGREHTVDLNGPNQCEVINSVEHHAILERLGPDPLRRDAHPLKAWARIHASRVPIGLLLMDQSVIAGIGNIYRTEILHQLGIHPRTPGSSITRPQFTKLWTLAKTLLELGVKHNRIITIDLQSFRGDVEKAPRSKLFRIFKQKSCPACGSVVEQFAIAGRKAFACARCQPRT